MEKGEDSIQHILEVGTSNPLQTQHTHRCLYSATELSFSNDVYYCHLG